jgi:hypothetical protein
MVRGKYEVLAEANSHSSASASRLIPPASAFRHSVRYRSTAVTNWVLYSGPGLVTPSVFFFIPIQDRPDAGQSGIYKNCATVERRNPDSPGYCLCKKVTMLVYTAGDGETSCKSILLVVERHSALP